MGYSISNGERVPYSIGSEKVSYSIGNGTAAHLIMPTYSISSTAQPYSFALGEISKYTMGAEGKGTPVALGSQEKMTVKVLGTGLKTPAWKSVPSETEEKKPIIEPAPINETPINETQNATIVQPPAPEVVPAPAVVMLSIKGMVKDENETGLAGWRIDLAASDLTAIANTTSTEDGSYSFDNLTAGDYVVSEEGPEGWVAITPENGMTNVTLTDADATIDFVNQKIA